MSGKLTPNQRKWLQRIVSGEREGRGPLNTTFLSPATFDVLCSLKSAGLATGVIMFSSTAAGRALLTDTQQGADNGSV